MLYYIMVLIQLVCRYLQIVSIVDIDFLKLCYYCVVVLIINIYKLKFFIKFCNNVIYIFIDVEKYG